MAPARDVGFVLIGDARAAAVEGDFARFCEVEDEFVAVVDEARGVDGFEMARADDFSGAGFDGDGFDPVEGVLEDEERRRTVC